MRFRKEIFEYVTVIDQPTAAGLAQKIRELAEKYIIIDLQYAVNRGQTKTWYSALVLYRTEVRRWFGKR